VKPAWTARAAIPILRKMIVDALNYKRKGHFAVAVGTSDLTASAKLVQ